jgi:hypothetical protein
MDLRPTSSLKEETSPLGHPLSRKARSLLGGWSHWEEGLYFDSTIGLCEEIHVAGMP